MTENPSRPDPSAADPTLATGGPGAQADLPVRIGHYTIKRKIASGGMGTVYEAVQEQPRRTVAVKVMRAGVVSPETLRRFEYEAQLLARLRHPGIAQVYEAGTHDDGHGPVPYFAMEYIPNAKPITRYAEDKKLRVRERLELFAKICDAVHHGHQKGIIHRDLKPGNILVDSQGYPRVIDFGVARATDSDMALQTFQTAVGQIIGSIQYMSPEQFEADPNDIDTRSDVYALGIVLYELLRGELPYDVTKTSIVEAARIVHGQEPTRLGDGRPALRGDVETIVQKALEKDRDRRYQSAFGLAEDIRRYLRGEAIVARPPSITYQLRVFARRNRTLLGAVAAVFVVLVAGVIVSTSLFFHAQRERERAEAQTAKAVSVTGFLKDTLGSTIPVGYGAEVTIADLLDQASTRVDAVFPDDPAVAAELHRTIGLGYKKLALYEQSEIHLKQARALVPEIDPGRVEAQKLLTELYQLTGRNTERVEALRELLRLTHLREGPESERALDVAHELAIALADLGRLEEAEQVASGTLDARRRLAGEDDPRTLDAGLQVTGVRILEGSAAQAETLARQLLGTATRTLGAEDRVTITARSHLAAAFIMQNKFDDAAALYGNRRIPRDIGVRERFQGGYDPDGRGTQLLVFWETWCPFSQRALPRIEEFYRQYQGELQVVGLTEVTRSATDDKVRDFISSKGVTFPILKIDGGVKPFFGMQGTPWGALVRNGRVIWEDNVDTPEVISGVLLKGLLGAG